MSFSISIAFVFLVNLPQEYYFGIRVGACVCVYSIAGEHVVAS